MHTLSYDYIILELSRDDLQKGKKGAPFDEITIADFAISLRVWEEADKIVFLDKDTESIEVFNGMEFIESKRQIKHLKNRWGEQSFYKSLKTNKSIK